MLQMIFSIVALIIIALTMLFSAADLKLTGFRWNVRRLAFIMAGVGAVGLIFMELFHNFVPNKYQVFLHVGTALIFMTNPFQIPWHKWIWKGSNGGVA